VVQFALLKTMIQLSKSHAGFSAKSTELIRLLHWGRFDIRYHFRYIVLLSVILPDMIWKSWSV